MQAHDEQRAVSPADPGPKLYRILPADKGWMVQASDRYFHFSTLTGATMSAMRAAFSDAAQGHFTQVLTRGRGGTWKLLWDSCIDEENFGG
jgi:hypothetical protein